MFVDKQSILKAFNFRHATKLYDETKKISDEDFQFILETGRLSPSSIGSEPWKFLVVQSPAMRAKLMEVCSGAVEKLRTASHFVIILARKDVTYDSNYLYNQMKHVHQLPEDVIEAATKGYKLFQEGKNILDNERTLFDWASKQTYIAMANMMTAAALIGIDSTPMEGFKHDELENLLAKEGLLEEGVYAPSVLVSFGYRKEKPGRPKTRRSFNDIVRVI